MKRKLIPVFLCIVFIITAFMVVGISSAAKTQDGIEATLNFSKTEYAIGENIDATLTVKNMGNSSVDVYTEIVLPEGVSLVSGSLKQSTFTLEAGADKTASVTLTKTAPSGSAPTGDGDTLIWTALVLISGIAFIFLAVKNNWIRARGVMSLMLCVALLSTVVLPVSISAASAQLTVEESVKIDGESTTVKAIVTYGAQGEVVEPENDDSGSDGSTGGSADNGGNTGAANNAGSADEGNTEGGFTSGSNNETTNGGTESVDPPVETNPEGEEIFGDGSAEQPYLEIPSSDMTVKTIAVPAGKTLHYSIYRVGGMYLTINDANAYVIYEGTRYDARNGRVSFKVENALASDAIKFEIGNNGSSDISFTLIFTNPTGTAENPTPVSTLGEDVTISLEAENEVGHYYQYYAEKSGTVRFYMTATADSILSVTRIRDSIPVQKVLDSSGDSDSEDILIDDQGRMYIEFEVLSGDEIVINVGAKPNRRNKYPATDITWNGQYN